MIDKDGFRLNVGIILRNLEGQVFWAKRIGQNAWQFPQGGIKPHETPEQALYRELTEEIGLTRRHVKVIGCTQQWLYYNLPPNLIRRNQVPLCIGQKQRWFILQLVGEDDDVRFDLSSKPEFDGWKWVNYWEPLQQVVFFKRQVYNNALTELSELVDDVPLKPCDELLFGKDNATDKKLRPKSRINHYYARHRRTRRWDT